MRCSQSPVSTQIYSVRVLGIDADSRPVSENSQLRNIRDQGAKLQHIVIQRVT
jgi:hypothetical protein